MDMIHELAFIF